MLTPPLLHCLFLFFDWQFNIHFNGMIFRRELLGFLCIFFTNVMPVPKFRNNGRSRFPVNKRLCQGSIKIGKNMNLILTSTYNIFLLIFKILIIYNNYVLTIDHLLKTYLSFLSISKRKITENNINKTKLIDLWVIII